MSEVLCTIDGAGGLRLQHCRRRCYGEGAMSGVEPSPAQAVNRLVDEYRVRCLWFLREDYYPTTDEQRSQALTYIQRYGDREAYRRAAEIRRWLSPTSSAPSAAS